MTINPKPPYYRTFLLTFWEESNKDPNLPSVWRFRLEDPRTHQRRGFATMAELLAFLQAHLSGREDETSDWGQIGSSY